MYDICFTLNIGPVRYRVTEELLLETISYLDKLGIEIDDVSMEREESQ